MTERTQFDDSREWLAFIDAKGGTCNAQTRAGTPCKRRNLYSNGRCNLHGGLSTGPTTEGGKKKSALNGHKGGRPKKPTCHEMLRKAESMRT